MNCPHCDTHIDEHDALPCLDTWVADVVLGWAWLPTSAGFNDDGSTRFGDPLFSVEIKEAWRVVEKLLEKDVLARVRLDSGIVRQWITWASNIEISTWASGETAPLAICRAAIKVTLND